MGSEKRKTAALRCSRKTKEPRFFLEVRANGCAGVLATLPVYFDSAISTTENVPVEVGEWLQFYIAGTALNPTAGIEFAYQAPA